MFLGLLLGSAFSAGDVRRLSPAESSDLCGAGGSCTGSKLAYDKDGRPVYGCSTSPCTAVQNVVADKGTGSKIEANNCTWTDGSGKTKYCGSVTIAVKCSK